MDDLSFVVEWLPTLPALETLCLGHGMLDHLPAPIPHDCLRHVSFDTFLMSAEEVTLLLDWTCGLVRLEHISFRNIYLGEGPRASMQRALRHWFSRANITYVRLACCDLDEDAVADVASALGSSTWPLALDLVQNDQLDLQGACRLLDALAPLATCTLRVTLVAKDRNEILSYAHQLPMIIDDSGDDEYTFFSGGRV
ncbi:hypothetical protein SPRG_14720 [Saprolegnia parasitica CBS 223.65]|uniref:F-box domain-containing protein n=1 Tax=Saprolegnia parasitica (strain CBS 223.65) TaxID=695850 RepID=A0A067BKU0_SAPPC|nr:hypothetical protein SPRG_14720 [Saprolegnia parasitica CBS 223.65]KDO19084.1 hypothetical protein SPRG_14720 [Saprolegnia parasitica CBS 223.65]|eukprot:XP_012210211.1 hypothetical protein SPRG_14720 [Saprolegnia parasitica CBS 223.65]